MVSLQSQLVTPLVPRKDVGHLLSEKGRGPPQQKWRLAVVTALITAPALEVGSVAPLAPPREGVSGGHVKLLP